MPQLDFSTYASQVFWLLASFFILYQIMARVALPMVRETLSDRRTRIDNDLKRAEKLKAEAESAQSDFTSALDNSKKEAHHIIAQARANIEQLSKEKHAELDETFARQQRESELHHAKLKQQAEEAMHDISAHMVALTVGKLLHKTIDTDIVSKAVHEAMTVHQI